MPLTKGPNTIRKNMAELVGQPVMSPARHKALLTIAKKHNITYDQAKYKQALAISKFQARKK